MRFEQGKDPKAAMGIGRKHKIQFGNYYEMEGPMANKDRAEKLRDEVDKEMDRTRAECEEEEIYDDRQMDMVDEILFAHEDEFRKLGYDYTEDWK